MGKGGGTPPPSQSTVTQTNLPEYVEPYFKDLLKKAQTESGTAYVPYEKERLAGLQPEHETALTKVRGIVDQDVGGARIREGAGILSDAGKYTPASVAYGGQTGQVGYGYDPRSVGYTPGQFTPGYTAAAGPAAFQAGQIEGAYDPTQITSGYTAGQIEGAYDPTQITSQYTPGEISSAYTAGQIGSTYDPTQITSAYAPDPSQFTTQKFTDPGVASEYMNPFVENVINRQQARARRQFAEEQMPAMRAGAVEAGAFGGSRAAIQQQLARSRLEERLGDIESTQRGQAYREGQSAFTRDRAEAQRAQQMRDAAARAAGQMGMSAQQATAQEQRAAAQLGLSGQEAQERARQEAGKMGLTAQQAQEAARQQAGQMGLSAQQAMAQEQRAAAQLGLSGREAQERARQQAGQMGLTAQQAMAQEQRAAAQMGLSGQEAQEQARARAAQLGLTGYEAQERARQQQAQFGMTAQKAREQARQQAAQVGLSEQQLQARAAQERAQLGVSMEGLRAKEAQARAQTALESGRLGLAGAQQRAAVAKPLAAMGQAQQAFALKQGDVMRQVGDIRAANKQQQLDLQLADFLSQRDFPKTQMGWFGGMLHGVPVSPTQESTVYRAQPPIPQQLLGFGLGGASILNQLRG